MNCITSLHKFVTRDLEFISSPAILQVFFSSKDVSWIPHIIMHPCSVRALHAQENFVCSRTEDLHFSALCTPAVSRMIHHSSAIIRLEGRFPRLIFNKIGSVQRIIKVLLLNSSPPLQLCLTPQQISSCSYLKFRNFMQPLFCFFLRSKN